MKINTRNGFVYLLLGLGLLAACSDNNRTIETDLGNAPTLSAGVCPIIHCNTEQTDALPLFGPSEPSRKLSEEDIDHLWSSPIAGGILDYVYPNGERVFWVPQVDRVMKLQLTEDNYLVKVAELPLEPKNFPRFSPEDMQAIVGELDTTEFGSKEYNELADYWDGYQREGLRAYYAMINNSGILYVSNKNGVIAYSDAEPGNPKSGIAKVGQYDFKKLELQLSLKMPLVILIGLNMTPDGHIIAVTIDGTIIGIKPDLSEAYYHNLKGEQIWNSMAIDEKGGIYVNGNRALHKLVWTGQGFSADPNDGAWVETYENGGLNESLRTDRGSGTTPALMGSSNDKDRFVVNADGADVNNLIFYWRDDIPEDWKQLPGTRSRRIAGILPVNFGNESATSSYSENSATVFEYGAVLANNQVKTNEQMTLNTQLKMKDPNRTPYGVQKFQWNTKTQQMEVAWVRNDVSSPNSTPVVSMKNRQLHVVGLKEGQWVMETLDWDTGKTRAVYILGRSERYNPIMLALQILPNGDPIFAAFGGIMHLRIGKN